MYWLSSVVSTDASCVQSWLSPQSQSPTRLSPYQLPHPMQTAHHTQHSEQCLWFLSQIVLNSLSRRWARFQQPPLSAVNNMRKPRPVQCFFIFLLEINCMLARPSLLRNLFRIGKGRHFKIDIFIESFYLEFSILRQLHAWDVMTQEQGWVGSFFGDSSASLWLDPTGEDSPTALTVKVVSWQLFRLRASASSWLLSRGQVLFFLSAPWQLAAPWSREGSRRIRWKPWPFGT